MRWSCEEKPRAWIEQNAWPRCPPCQPSPLDHAEVESVLHAGAGISPAALLVSGKLRFQGPPQTSGLQDFLGFSAQMNSLGEPPRATRHLALPHGGQAMLGKITWVCVF